ncbi:MAG: ATP-binding cassette domain-containing protein [Chloroflexi bacterium]|nr:ATP-binding cassette domain-containing protein [Chloroflexota bacterium]
MTIPLRIERLTKRFNGFTAVNAVSLEVHPGEVFALLGPNGAGKTTTIRMVMGILIPDEGEVQIFGQPPREARERVGYLPEARGLYRNVRVLELLTYLGRLKGLSPEEAQERSMAWLTRFDLSAWAEHQIHELSHGMQQKVQLAAALLSEPPLVILDEPFQGLDPVNIQLVKGLIRELRERGQAILLSSHQLHHVEALADRVALIDHGRIVEQGNLADLRQQYAQGDIAIRLAPGAQLPEHIPGVARVTTTPEGWRLFPQPGVAPSEILKALLSADVPIESFERTLPTLEDIFLQAVEAAHTEEAHHAVA